MTCITPAKESISADPYVFQCKMTHFCPWCTNKSLQSLQLTAFSQSESYGLHIFWNENYKNHFKHCWIFADAGQMKLISRGAKEVTKPSIRLQKSIATNLSHLTTGLGRSFAMIHKNKALNQTIFNRMISKCITLESILIINQSISSVQ